MAVDFSVPCVFNFICFYLQYCVAESFVLRKLIIFLCIRKWSLVCFLYYLLVECLNWLISFVWRGKDFLSFWFVSQLCHLHIHYITHSKCYFYIVYYRSIENYIESCMWARRSICYLRTLRWWMCKDKFWSFNISNAWRGR